MLPIAQEHGQVAREHDSGCPGAQLSITNLPHMVYHVGNASQVAREHARVSTCDELPGSTIGSIAHDHDSPFTFS